MTLVQARPTLVLVDDHELFRQGLRALLADEFDILAEGSTAADALQLSSAYQPDGLLLDVELKGDPAEQTVRAVRRLSNGVTIIILTMFEDVVLKRQLLRAGASDFISKSTDRDRLVARLSVALLAGPHASTQVETPLLELLTQRELEVLRLVSTAASNREIGQELSITEATVKRHVANTFLKLKAVSRLDAVMKARRLGLLN